MTNPATLDVALVGQHTDDFSAALKTNDLKANTYESFESLSTKGAKHAAVVFAPGSHVLTEANVTEILKAKTVLAVFEPSREMLQTIHDATKTPIDIPSLSLAKGYPLMLYMADDTIHIATNNLPSEAEADKIAHKVLEGDDKASADGVSRSIKMLRLSPAEHSAWAIRRAALKTQAGPQGVINLQPPPDVIGFKKVTVDNTIPQKATWLRWDKDGNDKETTDANLIQRWDLNWYTDLHCYATGADPRNKNSWDFTHAGGIVYTVAIDRGNIQRTSNSPQKYWGPTTGYCSYWLIDSNKMTSKPDSSMNMETYIPGKLIAQSGTLSNYVIEYQQDMQMFNDNGQSHYTFKAQYSRDFSHEKFQQHAVQDGRGVTYSVDYKDHYDYFADPWCDTDAWWQPGVFEEVNKDGKKYKVVRASLPDTNTSINGLTVFSSSVGNPTINFIHSTHYRAFKSPEWQVSEDKGKRYYRIAGFTLGGADWPYKLNLTWH